jgi:hypothetical protein
MQIRQAINDNKALFDQIAATDKMLKTLANTANLSQDSLTAFGHDMQIEFNKLEDTGLSTKQSLQVLAPDLATMLWYAKQYGYTLDANTLSLIEQAKAQGINLEAMKTPEQMQKEMLDISQKQLDAMSMLNDTMTFMAKILNDAVNPALNATVFGLTTIGQVGVSAFGAIGAAALDAANKAAIISGGATVMAPSIPSATIEKGTGGGGAAGRTTATQQTNSTNVTVTISGADLSNPKAITAAVIQGIKDGGELRSQIAAVRQ